MCRTHTHYLGKPVLLMDSSRRVTGVGDYDPFGHVDRVTYISDTPHPYGSTPERVLGFFSQKPTSTTSVQLRARYAYVDTASGTYAYLSNQWGSELTGARSEGEHLGRATSSWVQVPTDGRVQVRFHKGGSDPGTRYGAILEGYEYRRYETGASPVWLPLRLPGQYHDAEMDLFENWNRWYDPSIGRYLAPDPILLSPGRLANAAADGITQTVYAYANNNPITVSDPTGNIIGRVDGSWGNILGWVRLNMPQIYETIERSELTFDFVDSPYDTRVGSTTGDSFVAGCTSVLACPGQQKPESGHVDVVAYRKAPGSLGWTEYHELQHAWVMAGGRPESKEAWYEEVMSDFLARMMTGREYSESNREYWRRLGRPDNARYHKWFRASLNPFEKVPYGANWDAQYGGEIR